MEAAGVTACPSGYVGPLSCREHLNEEKTSFKNSFLYHAVTLGTSWHHCAVAENIADRHTHTHTHTHTETKYCNPCCACMPRVNKL